MIQVKMDFTTDSSGAATVTTALPFELKTGGVVYGVQYVNGTSDTTADITITSEQGDLSIPVLVDTDLDADVMYYPRVLENLNTDGSALTTHTMPLAVNQMKLVVAQGGDVKTGAVICYVISL